MMSKGYVKTEIKLIKMFTIWNRMLETFRLVSTHWGGFPGLPRRILFMSAWQTI